MQHFVTGTLIIHNTILHWRYSLHSSLISDYLHISICFCWSNYCIHDFQVSFSFSTLREWVHESKASAWNCFLKHFNWISPRIWRIGNHRTHFVGRRGALGLGVDAEISRAGFFGIFQQLVRTGLKIVQSRENNMLAGALRLWTDCAGWTTLGWLWMILLNRLYVRRLRYCVPDFAALGFIAVFCRGHITPLACTFLWALNYLEAACPVIAVACLPLIFLAALRAFTTATHSGPENIGWWFPGDTVIPSGGH